MPILVGSGRHITPAAAPVIRRPSMTWLAPDGTVWPLTDPALGWRLLRDVTGLGAASVTVTTDDRPGGGVEVRSVDLDERDIILPIRVGGSTHVEYLDRYRRLSRAFTQCRRLGPGVLRVSRPDGTQRQIAAWYRSGWHQAGSRLLAETAAVSLLCEDPMWTDVDDPQPTVWEFRSTPAPFLAPFPRVAPSTTLSGASLSNAGDDEAYPVWTVTGPADSITATLAATGEAWTFTPPPAHGPLVGGETVTITTEQMSARGPAGENWSAGLDFPANLWSVPPGVSAVTLSVVGADTGTTVTATVRARYESS